MSAKREYSKPPLSLEQQIELLQSRGLHIPDEKRAISFLKFVSYYRLSAYTFYYEEKDEHGRRLHKFYNGKTFDDIINLYTFDSKLRRMFFEAIESIEISFRTSIIYHMSHRHGSHWYTKTNLFLTKFNHNEFIDLIKNESGFQDQHNSDKRKMGEVFIQHYYENYSTPELPPSWMTIEILPLGSLSKIYSLLNFRNDQKNISGDFGLDPEIMKSWIRSLCYLRNLSAHYCRLWNRVFTIKPVAMNRLKEDMQRNDRLYAQAVMCNVFLQKICPHSNWAQRFTSLIAEYSYLPQDSMGFPKDWFKSPLWN